MPFAGGASPPLSVVSSLFSVSYPQARRSYYLFFNYLFFNYLYSEGFYSKHRGGNEGFYSKHRGGRVKGFIPGKLPRSPKPVDKNSVGRSWSGFQRPGYPRTPPTSRGASGAILVAGKGRCAAYRGRHSVPTRILRLSGSFVRGAELLVSLRQHPVSGWHVVDPFHLRAVEKCNRDRKGKYRVGLWG